MTDMAKAINVEERKISQNAHAQVCHPSLFSFLQIV
jgi:hypothetical protein